MLRAALLRLRREVAPEAGDEVTGFCIGAGAIAGPCLGSRRGWATQSPSGNAAAGSDVVCLDVAQQVNALTAAAREVSVLVLEAHLRACVRDAVEDDDGEAAIREMTDLVRKSLRG